MKVIYVNISRANITNRRIDTKNRRRIYEGSIYVNISRAKITNRRIDIKNRRRIYQGPKSSELVDVQKSKIKDSHI